MWQEFHLHLQDLGTLPDCYYKSVKLELFLSQYFSEREKNRNSQLDGKVPLPADRGFQMCPHTAVVAGLGRPQSHSSLHALVVMHGTLDFNKPPTM